MQISFQAQLIILGAVIAGLFTLYGVLVGGVFTLLGILLKDQIDSRRKRIEREEEKKEKDEALMLDLIEQGILNDPKVAVMRLPKREED